MQIHLMMHLLQEITVHKGLDYVGQSIWLVFSIFCTIKHLFIYIELHSYLSSDYVKIIIRCFFVFVVVFLTTLYLQTMLPQFFASDERIKAVRKMIMAADLEERQKALDLLLPYQRSDFEGIFRAMDGRIIHQ